MAGIERDVREAAATFLQDGFEAPYIGTSYFMIQRFVSKAVAEQYFEMDGGTMTAQVGTIMTTVSETIFELRNRPALVEFCRRVRTRKPHSAFHEALAARIFMENGFAIMAIGESGVKGKDFDFRARKQGSTVFVEVTALEVPRFSENTLQNAFGSKVKQLPKEGPGVIWCVLPESWFDVPDVAQSLAKEARRLLGVSKRVNAVVYLGEQYDEVTSGYATHGMRQYRSISVLNDSPRTPCEQLLFLATQRGEDMSRDPRLQDLGDEMALHKAMRDRPFFHWVDGLIGRGQANA